MVAKLLDGSVWLRHVVSGTNNADAIPHFLQNASGAFVPCSNGEELEWWMIMKRASDPFWNGGDVLNLTLPNKPSRGYVHYPATLDELLAHPDFIAQDNGIWRI